MHEKMVKRKNGRQQLIIPSQYRVTCPQGAEPEYSGRYRDFTGSEHFSCVRYGNAFISSHAQIVAKTRKRHRSLPNGPHHEANASLPR
jgi:hypothetical protein